jgi:hypothetical protein
VVTLYRGGIARPSHQVAPACAGVVAMYREIGNSGGMGVEYRRLSDFRPLENPSAANAQRARKPKIDINA